MGRLLLGDPAGRSRPAAAAGPRGQTGKFRRGDVAEADGILRLESPCRTSGARSSPFGHTRVRTSGSTVTRAKKSGSAGAHRSVSAGPGLNVRITPSSKSGLVTCGRVTATPTTSGLRECMFMQRVNRTGRLELDTGALGAKRPASSSRWRSTAQQPASLRVLGRSPVSTSVSMATTASGSPCRAWKCGTPCSRRGRKMTMPCRTRQCGAHDRTPRRRATASPGSRQRADRADNGGAQNRRHHPATCGGWDVQTEPLPPSKIRSAQHCRNRIGRSSRR